MQITKQILWSNVLDTIPDNAIKIAEAVNKLLSTENKTEVIQLGFTGYAVIGNEIAKKRYTMLCEALTKHFNK